LSVTGAIPTIVVAKYQEMIVMGRAMMYRIRFAKLNSRKKFPINPVIKETTLSQ